MDRLNDVDADRFALAIDRGAADSLDPIEDRIDPEPAELDIARPTNEQLARLARSIHAERYFRNEFLDCDLLGEPVYDMLLMLFAASLEGKRMSVTDLTVSSGVPQTTALRWINVLHDRGYTRRTPNPNDARVVYIEIEPEGRARMTAFLQKAWERRVR